jgi:dipeptidyl aminopeptidase/acylaminoacyl peptidase
MKINRFLVAVFISLNGAHFPAASAQEAKRPFTVDDDIELTHFDVELDPARVVRFSPDGRYFVFRTERGRLDLNRCEDSLRFYRSEEVRDFLNTPDEARPSAPAWVVAFSTFRECPIVRDWRWLADSSGVAFLQRAEDGTQRLVLAILRNRTVEELSSDTDAVKDFDIRDRKHFVYAAADPAQHQKSQSKREEPSTVVTGRDFYHLFFPNIEAKRDIHGINLWAVVDGKRFQVKNQSVLLAFASGALALSPDGRSMITMVPVPDVPASWETLYPPSEKYAAWGIHAGHQDLEFVYSPVVQYVQVDLQTGVVRTLVDAPSSAGVGWWTQGDPSWSSDGEAILLPGTFLPPEGQGPFRPCVAVVDLASNSSTCVMKLKDQSSAVSMQFVGGDRRRVSVLSDEGKNPEVREYQQTSSGAWGLVGQITKSPAAASPDFVVTVKESLNEPPRLVATNNRISRVILDPNPQLENLESGAAEVYTWKAKDGRVWRGGLYKVGNYERGKRYPLVIQTHGFVESRYIPSGSFQAGFAARAFAGDGITVLQVDDDHQCSTRDTEEIPCAVSGYEAAASQLVKEGLIDPEKIGIIGFSHTCLWTIGALTSNSSLRFKAALITDGVMADYNQYLMSDDDTAHYFDKLIGARPIGQGLRGWLERSPGFNLDRVAAPLLVVGEGRESLLSMWQPYAVLHFMKKPVELIMLNTTEHDLSNPAVRLASQGGSVDWFRFWLQDYEAPDPAKSEQYRRWRELRKMQEGNEKKSSASGN